jgi:hypothetical protein
MKEISLPWLMKFLFLADITFHEGKTVMQFGYRSRQPKEQSKRN